MEDFQCTGEAEGLGVGEKGSSGSSGRVRGGPRNMKSKQPPTVAIFFMTYFHRAGGGMAPSAPPGSATGRVNSCFNII